MIFQIQPKVGVGAVKLGMTSKEVLGIFGRENLTSSRDSQDFYFNASFQIEYTDDLVTFIGVSQSNTYTLLYEETNVFDVSADKLFSLIASRDGGEHQFNVSEYLFPNQIITLWDADEQYDRLGGEERVVWSQVGIGSTTYLKSIQELYA